MGAPQTGPPLASLQASFFCTVEVERKGGRGLLPSKDWQFLSVVHIPKEMTRPCPGNDASRGTAPADSVCRQVLTIHKVTEELPVEEL